MGGDPYRNFKMDEEKDRAIALLGKTGAGKSSFINSITNKKECKIGKKAKSCTSKIQIVQKLIDNKNYYFIDTPGLDDGEGDKKNIAELEKLRDYPRISSLLICLPLSEIRLSDSVKNTIKKIMDIFPSQDFWEHVIIIRTWTTLSASKLEKHKKRYKGEILKGILDDNELNQYMNKKKINTPSNLKEFYVDCDPDGLEQETQLEFTNIVNEIKNKYPIYKNIKFESEKEIIENFKQDDSSFLKITTQRKITFTDFNNESHELIEILNNEVYNLDGIQPLLIEVKRVQDEKPRGILCWSNQFKTHYIIVKIYELNNIRRRLEYEYEFRYETKENDDEVLGEQYREELQEKFNNICSGV